jgi:hypothetical protein
MKAQISFEMVLWLLISSAFLLASVTFSYGLLHNESWQSQGTLYANALAAANLSIYPYSEFGMMVGKNAT